MLVQPIVGGQQDTGTGRTFFARIQIVEPALHARINVLLRLTLFGHFDDLFVDTISVHTIGHAAQGLDALGDDADFVLTV